MTVSVRPFRTKTPLQTVTVPDRFEELIREIYKDFRLAVEYVPATPPQAIGKVKSHFDFMRGIASILVQETGSDTPDVVVDLLRRYKNGFVDLIHVILPLSGDVNPVVERLVEAGCGFGALLPQYGEDPHLVMQSISPELLPPVSQAVLSPRAARILAGLG